MGRFPGAWIDPKRRLHKGIERFQSIPKEIKDKEMGRHIVDHIPTRTVHNLGTILKPLSK